MNKIISFGIPCYNSAEYMGHCIESILEGSAYSDDIEILIIDDGSTKDDTAHIADAWQERYPAIIRAIHQENGGHGRAVMCAVEHANGIYFKNVDSDDWLDKDALGQFLTTMRDLAETQATSDLPDLLISNYVYEHTYDGTQNIVHYRRKLPKNRIFTWDDIKHFSMTQYLLMHALTYKTEVLKTCGLEMPAHTFYVDNIYAYVPFPACKKLYYIDVDLYRYFIGREDQSVNEKVLISRVDHYWRVARIMRDAYHLYDDIESENLREYMMGYLTVIMAICSVFSKLSDRDDAIDTLDELWAELKAYDKKMYYKARRGFIGTATNLPGKAGRRLTIDAYRIAQHVVKFN